MLLKPGTSVGCSRADAAAGYQIVVSRACVFAPRQLYGSCGSNVRNAKPTLKDEEDTCPVCGPAVRESAQVCSKIINSAMRRVINTTSAHPQAYKPLKRLGKPHRFSMLDVNRRLHKFAPFVRPASGSMSVKGDFSATRSRSRCLDYRRLVLIPGRSGNCVTL